MSRATWFRTEATDSQINEVLDQRDKLIEENSRLREELDKIANPITYFQKEAQAQGGVLNGGMAALLANDANWLRSVAKEALAR